MAQNQDSTVPTPDEMLQAMAIEIQHLRHEVATQQQAYEDLRQQSQPSRTSPPRIPIADLAEALRLNSHSPSLQVPTLSESLLPYPTQRPRHALSHLSKFSGQREEWDAWRIEADIKISTDGAAIGNEQAQFGYLYNSISPAAQLRLAPWVADTRTNNPRNATPTAFFTQAAKLFGDPFAQGHALAQLNQLRQGKNQRFNDHVSKFEELLSKAGGSYWADIVKINFLRTSLNNELANRLVSYPGLATDYEAWKNTVLSVDANLHEFQQRSRQLIPQMQAPSPRTTSSPNEMDWEATQVAAVRGTTPARAQ